MADRYQQFTKSPIGRFVVPKLGLPSPTPLRRYTPGQPALDGPALVGAAPNGRLEKTLTSQLADAGIEVRTEAADGTKYGALVFDATGIKDPKDLRELHKFFHPVIRKVGDFGKPNWPRFGILNWPRRLGCGIGRHLDVAPPAVVGRGAAL